MIVAVPGEFGLDDHIVCPPITVDGADVRQLMLERARVAEGSYAYALIDQLHTGIFIQSLDLKADYESYFASEYESFTEYLCRRERLSSSVVAKLANAFEGSVGIYRFRPRHSFLGDSSGVELLSSLLEDPTEREETQ
jgi:hypothetical protein